MKDLTTMQETHRRHGFNPWVGEDPLEKKMAVFLSGKSYRQRTLAGYSLVHGVAKS